MSTDNVVKEIIEYVGYDNFVFGNIAFSYDGEDRINIGSELLLGTDAKTIKSQLAQKNVAFGEKLNKQECFSTTKYLEDREIKVLSISFHHQGNKELIIVPFEGNEIHISYYNEDKITECSFQDYAPRFFAEYKAPNGSNKSSIELFKSTLNYYYEFYKIVYNISQDGFIYLIRPITNLGGNFAALAYMYLKKPLDSKDTEIISQKLSLHFMRRLKENAHKEAIKSAKAAIMSRNISHNLGSHVMAYMKQSLSSVQDMLKNGVLQYAPLDGVNMEGTEIPYLVGISKFLSYLQERQDYIATVSTDYIPYPSVVNFKDAIYDELNPDYRFQRHTEWTGHKPANILLENIAKSEGLSRKTFNETQRQDGNNILIKYGKFDGLNHETEKYDYEKLRQWNFSLPGGIMGRQAVFSIVENVIRNAAKHGTRENGEDLSITFDVFDPMVEENSVVDDKYYKAEDIRDLYVVKLTTSTVVSDKDLGKIHDAINDSLIEENGQLKQSNKGIKEMLISAAWLRNIKIEDLEHGQIDKKAPILRANKDLEEKLYYVFCLPKVKAVALITDRISEGSLGESVVSLMKKKGWYIFTVADYLKCQNKDFCFVIIDSKRIVDDEVIDNDVASFEAVEDDIKKNSHNRCFVASDYNNIERHRIKTDVFDNISDFNNEECFEKAELNLYKQLADEPDFKIAIADTEFRKSLKNQNVLGDISELVSVVDDGDDVETYRYVYRKHNDTAKHFKDFIKKQCGEYDFFHKLEFVEGITGGNSTDRLVRHSGLDNLWAYKQVHAMKTKVAIFDERIFTKTTGYEMADLGAESVKTWGFEGLSIEDAKENIYRYDEEHKKKIEDDVYDEWDSLQSIESVVAFANKYYPLQSSMKNNSDNINSMVFHKKGIDVFTLTWEKEKRFNIWGFVPDASMEDVGYGKIENVGVITVDDHNKPTIELYADSNNYHYLSIHQGLLDKVYEKICSGREANELKALKLAVTKGLHSKLVKCTRSEEDDYLQGLIIHSGRSKPNEENMPQHQPFVQYSAIENAIFDCKYTLVDLLDFACFDSTHG